MLISFSSFETHGVHIDFGNVPKVMTVVLGQLHVGVPLSLEKSEP